MKKVELVAQAKELGIKGYSKMTKEQLIDTIVKVTVKNEPVVQQLVETVQDTSEVDTAREALMFNLSKYASFTLYPNLRTTAVTSGQINLVKALETHFKVAIGTSKCDRGMLSDKIKAVYIAIQSGKVQPRPENQVKELLKSFNKQYAAKKATPAQLAKITALEKLTGVVNTTVIRDSKIASEVIQRYISLTKANKAQEVAVTTIEHEPVKQSFLNMVKVYVKGLFA